MTDKHNISDWMRGLQDRICRALEEADGLGRFVEDAWTRPGGGGGRTRTLCNGNIIEKGGVNFSEVYGELTERAGTALGIAAGPFFATGVSIVQHPCSPMVPIIHMNIRYFEAANTYWFGGGIDLTPHYVFREDARWFHQQLKAVCDQFDLGFYPKYKAEADDYFFIKHRNETRGVGGIFFDRVSENNEISRETLWQFTQAVGNAFAPIYTELMRRNASKPFTEKERDWQLIRRGRYAEFNLAIDRGTRFGLETDGRTESILMSLPPLAKWEYNHLPEPNSPEAETLTWLRKGVEY